MDFWVQRDGTLQRCPDPRTHCARVGLLLQVSAHPNALLKLWPLRTAVKSREPGHTPRHWRAGRKDNGEREEESLPTVTDHLVCKEHRTRSAESTFHLHFKQIGGLVGHYHLECPVMGNRVGKGAVHCWLIFTKVFVWFFPQTLMTQQIELNKKDTVDWNMVLCPSNPAFSLLGLWWIPFFNSRLVFVKNLLQRLRGSQEWRNARLAAINHLLLKMNWSFFFKVTVHTKVSNINMQSIRAIPVAWSR